MRTAALAPTLRRRPRPSSQPFSPQTHFPHLGVPDDANQAQAVAVARASRRRPGNRYNPHPLTGDPEYTPEQLRFLRAVIEWRERHRAKPFPTNIDVFAIVQGMGYRLVPHGFKLVPIAEPEPAPAPVPPLRVVRPD